MIDKNIFQLWREGGEVLPFLVKRNWWKNGHSLIVESIMIDKWPYGKALGSYSFDNFSSQIEISCAGCYQWERIDCASTEEPVQA